MDNLRNAALAAIDFLEFGGRRHDRVFHIDALKEALNEHDQIDCNNCVFLGKKGSCTATNECRNGEQFEQRPPLRLYDASQSKEEQ